MKKSKPVFKTVKCSPCKAWIAVPAEKKARDQETLDTTVAAMSLEDAYKVSPESAGFLVGRESETAKMCPFCAFLHGLDAMQDAKKKSDAKMQDAFENQGDELFEAMAEKDDLFVRSTCLVGAAFDIASRDYSNNHKTPITKLVPEAIERAKQLEAKRAVYTTDWDWKATPDTIMAELNRVLNPRGIHVQYPDECDFDDIITFEFVPMGWQRRDDEAEEAK